MEEKITLVTQKRDLFSLPKDLPVPKDDGACVHLEGMLVPSIKLRSTGNGLIDLSIEAKNPTVVFFYPRTGEPSKPAPPDWDLIPGARGCTPNRAVFEIYTLSFKKMDLSIRS